MFCPNCGKGVRDGAGFCTWCGAQIKPQAAAAPAAQPTSAPKRQRSRGPIIAVIVVALLIIAGAGGFLLWSTMFAPYEIDGENFPNPAVLNAVSEQLDPDGDGKITREEAAAAAQLTISGTNDVSGLGTYFPNLATLSIDAEQANDGDVIAVGDLSGLKTLEVANTAAGSIDLSGNTGLETLTVSNAPDLAVLDLSNNEKLAALKLNTTGVGELDLSANTSLVTLEVDGEGEGAITLPATETLTNVSVPENRPLNGIENTGLREVWDVTSISSVPASFGDAGARADIERDAQGRIASIVANNSRGTDTYEFSYDEGGNLVGYSFSALDSDEVTIAYNENGDIASAEGRLSSRSYTYDDQGRVVTMNLVDEYGSSTTTFTYDEAGNLIREFIPDDDSENYVEVDYSYDGAGNLVKRVEREGWGEGVAGTSGPGSIDRIYAYEYDGAGNRIRTTISTSSVQNGTVSDVTELAVYEAAYDEGGNITKFVANITGSNESIVETYVYDERGVLVRIEGSGGWGYDYEFGYGRRLVAKDATEGEKLEFVSDPTSGAEAVQNLYYNYCAYSLMAPDYVGTSSVTRLSMVICGI